MGATISENLLSFARRPLRVAASLPPVGGLRKLSLRMGAGVEAGAGGVNSVAIFDKAVVRNTNAMLWDGAIVSVSRSFCFASGGLAGDNVANDVSILSQRW